ncbi:MAG: phosphoribosylaminoimidazolesuccinocarboxamide synthase [Candidatus Cloacimonetes bacterium]|nr:phosphoribosylaminoimidazolesuccinocarboxamide synthase [Candidatus Cloacimonadota bacterium]
MSLSKEGLKLLHKGKTKDVYEYDEKSILLYSKDCVTGWVVKNPDGTTTVVEDPGANEVIGEVAGIGSKNIVSSVYYFKKFTEAGIENHFIDADLGSKNLLVKKCTPIGKGMECIVRFKAMGSIVRAYPDYLKTGQTLTDFFEVTTKNDAAGDPRISKELLLSKDFGSLMTEKQYEETRVLCLSAAKLIKDDLSPLGYELIDIKFEIGLYEGRIILIDEVSAGIMRVFKGDKALSEGELAVVLAH